MSLIANLAEPAGTESHEQQEELTVRPPNKLHPAHWTGCADWFHWYETRPL